MLELEPELQLAQEQELELVEPVERRSLALHLLVSSSLCASTDRMGRERLRHGRLERSR